MKKSWLKLALCVGVCAALGAVCFMGACGGSNDDDTDLSNETFKEREFKSSDLDTFKTGMGNTLSYEDSYTLTAGVYGEGLYSGIDSGSFCVTYAYDKEDGRIVDYEALTESVDGVEDEDGGWCYMHKNESGSGYTQYIMYYETGEDNDYDTYSEDEGFDELVEYYTVSALAGQVRLTDVSDISDEDGIVEYISDYLNLDEDIEMTLAVKDGSSGSVEYIASCEATESYSDESSVSGEISVSIVIHNEYVTSINIDEVVTSSDNETVKMSVSVTIAYTFDESLWPASFDAWTNADKD